MADWTAALDALGRDYEIVVVDDGSADGTADQMEALAKAKPRLRLLRHGSRRGYGAALRTGIDATRHPVLCLATCDRQYHPADLPRLVATLEKVDLVTGYRVWQPPPLWLWAVHGLYRGLLRMLFGAAPPPRASWLGWSGFGRRMLARWVFGVRVLDPECAFRACRRTLLSRVPLQSDGPFAKVELLAKANFLGGWLAEEPVAYAQLPQPETAVDGAGRDKVRVEAWRLFDRPDFGPPFLPEPPRPEPPQTAQPQPGPASLPLPGPRP
jgi:glycosyltransferase involved in cell wall biosynthesis